jgi:predicted nucleotidyltransferase
MAMKQWRLKNAKVDELERAYDKCLVYFFEFPKRTIGLTELSKFIGSSKTATKKAVEDLIKQNFLTREVAGKTWILLANQKHRYFLIRKVPYHLKKIYESGVVEAIRQALPQARVISLFGSYRWGDDTEESDVDISVEVLDNKELEVRRLGVIEQLGYRKKVPVNLHIFSQNKIDINLYANIVNGIVLDGFLEVRL